MQVLHGDKLGHRKAIVHLDQAQLLARLVDAGLLIGALGGDTRGREVAAVPGVVLRFQAVGDGDLQGLDRDEILLAEALGDLGRGDDGAGRAVAHAAAIIKAERFGDRSAR